jgi:uncharacterized protein (DUF486 family)
MGNFGDSLGSGSWGSWFPLLRTIGLLILSNIFMTAAWYGHLRFKGLSMVGAIFMGWCLAFPEYAFQVPANRLGYQSHLSAYQLKILQECITLVIFVGFAWVVLGEAPQPKHGVSFILLVAAVVVAFR